MDELIKEKSKSSGDGKRAKSRAHKTFKKKFRQFCLASDSRGSFPSARELKQLVVLAENSEDKDASTEDRDNDSKSKDGSSPSASSVSSSSSTSSAHSPDRKAKRHKKKKKGKLKSGRFELVDEMDIVKVVKYAHAKLDSDFVRVKKFDQLPFHHLVAGELELIGRKHCSDQERMARVGILKYLAYHFAFLDTDELREQYDSIMKRVERGELDWSSNLARKVHKSLTYRREALDRERNLSDAKTRAVDKSKATKVNEKKGEKTKDKAQEEIIYCADFNRGKCTFSTSHLGKWAGREVMKLHICRKCLAEDGAKKAHTEMDETCPNKA